MSGTQNSNLNKNAPKSDEENPQPFYLCEKLSIVLLEMLKEIAQN